MANSIPMWWMYGRPQPQPQPTVSQMPPPNQGTFTVLTERIRRTDPETLLLLALLWLLWQEQADRKLLLALAYIAW